MPGLYGIPDIACQIVSYGEADGTNVVTLAGPGRRVFLHSVTTGAVSTAQTLRFFHGDGVTPYTPAGLNVNGTLGLNFVYDWLLTDGLALQATAAVVAQSGWVVAYMLPQ